MRVHTYGAHPQTPELEDESTVSLEKGDESSKNLTPLLGGVGGGIYIRLTAFDNDNIAKVIRLIQIKRWASS